MTMLRRTFLAAFVAFCLAGAALPAPAGAATGDDATKFIQDLARRAIATVADGQLSETARNDSFRSLFVSSFDIPAIARFVLGRYWRNATPDQQQEFVKLFEDFNVQVWTKRFEDYHGESLKTVGTGTKEGDQGWLVESSIVRNQGPPISVQWRLEQSDGAGFRIVDIIVDGVSMALTYRSDYASALQGNGGKIDALLASLRTKNDQLRPTR
jgi:phospholipid transport system substrate-binding protein